MSMPNTTARAATTILVVVCVADLADHAFDGVGELAAPSSDR